MPPNQAKRSKSVDQSKLFIEKAREIGADGDTDTAAVMRQLAGQPKTERKPLKAKKAAK